MGTELRLFPWLKLPSIDRDGSVNLKIRTTTYDASGKEVFSEALDSDTAKVEFSGLEELQVSIKGHNEAKTQYTVLKIPLLPILEGLGGQIDAHKPPAARIEEISAKYEMSRLVAKNFRSDIEDNDVEVWVEESSLEPSDRSNIGRYSIIDTYDQLINAATSLRSVIVASDELREAFAKKLSECEAELAILERRALPKVHSEAPTYEERYAKFFRSVLELKGSGFADRELQELHKLISTLMNKS